MMHVSYPMAIASLPPSKSHAVISFVAHILETYWKWSSVVVETFHISKFTQSHRNAILKISRPINIIQEKN
jgi:hypothetical protein